MNGHYHQWGLTFRDVTRDFSRWWRWAEVPQLVMYLIFGRPVYHTKLMYLNYPITLLIS